MIELTAYDQVDDWVLLKLGEPAGAAPLPMAPDLPLEKTGWWTFGYPGLNSVEGINPDLLLLDPNVAYERGTAIAVSSEMLKSTDVGGLSGAPLMRGRNVYGILRSDLEEERAEGRRSFGILYATAIGKVLDRADLQSARPNPYQGMRPFEEDRAGYFFGRAAEAEQLAESLRTSHLAVLMGGSGSGKSSLLRAGLLPLVRAGRLADGAAIHPIVFRPGTWALQELALPLFEYFTFPQRPDSIEKLRDALAGSETALADLVDQELRHRYGDRSKGGLLLVVDQMEELYAGEDGTDARSMLRILCGSATRRDSRVWVAGAIRDGFMGDLLAPSPDTETLRAGLVPARPDRHSGALARADRQAGGERRIGVRPTRPPRSHRGRRGRSLRGVASPPIRPRPALAGT